MPEPQSFSRVSTFTGYGFRWLAQYPNSFEAIPSGKERLVSHITLVRNSSSNSNCISLPTHTCHRVRFSFRSFLDYFNEYFVPYFKSRQPKLTREELVEALSIKSIESYLASSAKIGVITNEDDFILAPGELDYLRRVFGPRLKVYPSGGHLGNLEYRDNMAFLIDRLRSSTW